MTRACDCYGLTVQYSTVQYSIRYLSMGVHDRTPPSTDATKMPFDVQTPHEGVCQITGVRKLQLFYALKQGSNNAIKGSVARMPVDQLDDTLYDNFRFDGPSPLTFAAWQDNTKGIEALVERGASIDKKDAAGWSPLFMAVQQENFLAARMLLILGAAVDSYNEELGESVMDAAIQNNNQWLVALLDQYGFKRHGYATRAGNRGVARVRYPQ